MTLRQRGFSLLEMIAALTVLAMGTVVLFAWLQQTTNQLSRFQAQEKESLVRLRVIDYLATLNPVATPTGKTVFDTFTVTWKSVPISEMRESMNGGNGFGLYKVGLFEVEVTVLDATNNLWFKLKPKLAGYDQVRQVSANVLPL